MHLSEVELTAAQDANGQNTCGEGRRGMNPTSVLSLRWLASVARMSVATSGDSHLRLIPDIAALMRATCWRRPAFIRTVRRVTLFYRSPKASK
jgi:hypothetical protein